MNLTEDEREYIARKIGVPVAPPQDDARVAMLAAIDRYLINLPSSSWGMHFSIDKPEGRERAAAYILNLMRGVAKELQ